MSELLHSPPHHKIILVPPPGHQWRQPLFDQCVVVRTDVFVHEQQFPPDTELDEHDPTAAHFLLRFLPSLTPIGTVRVYKTGENCYKLSRLAVLKEHREYGFGRDLLVAVHKWAQDDAIRSGSLQPVRVVCHSQLPVKAFYAKYGYQPEGDEFDEEGAPHQKMVVYL